jgi:hypothetical protein
VKPRCSPLVLAALAACQTPPHANTRLVDEHALAFAPPVEAKQEPAPTYEPFGERFGLRVGGLVASSIDTTASLGVRGSTAGTDFDFERELGLAKQTESFRADAHWRFDRRNRIDVGYFNLTRSAERTLQRDIEWGDVTFPVGTTVSSFLDTRIIPVRYSHSFVATRTVDAGLGAGVYYMDLRTGLAGSASGISESFSTPVPLPVVSAHFAWEFLPRLQLVGLAQAFYIDVNGTGRIQSLRGRVIDATLGVEYAAHDNFGIGAGVNYFQIAVDTATQRLDLNFDYDYVALLVYVYLDI